MTVTVAAIHRYPVKGLNPEPLDRVALEPGQCLPHDRRFAITHGASRFDAREPDWQPKQQFLTLLKHEWLAQLSVAFDEASGVLTLSRNGRPVARGNAANPTGREVINQFLAAFVRGRAPGPCKLVEAPGIAFTDTKDNFVSIISRASVTDLERVTRKPLDPVRFRGNLLIDGAAPWAEFDWVGRTLQVGDARLKVVEPIGRCAATTVNPATAERDVNVPKALMTGFGHDDCGVYAEVVEGGTVTAGDTLAPI
jgi:hypothetical protein